MSYPDTQELPDETQTSYVETDADDSHPAGEIDETDEGSLPGDETGSEAAEGEAGESVSGADSEQETPVIKRSRAQERIRAQQAALQAEREEKARLAAELARLREQQEALLRQQKEAQNRAYLETLDPVERQHVLLQQQIQEVQRQQQLVQFQLQDQADRAQFQSQVTTNPLAAKYAERVEAELQKLRAAGQNAPRATILAYLVGQDMLTKAPAAVSKQRAASASRVKSAQGSPPNSRGNVRGGSDNESLDELEARLAGITF